MGFHGTCKAYHLPQKPHPASACFGPPEPLHHENKAQTKKRRSPNHDSSVKYVAHRDILLEIRRPWSVGVTPGQVSRIPHHGDLWNRLGRIEKFCMALIERGN